MYKETHNRSFLKTLSWRFFATVTTMILVFLFTGQVEIAVSVGGLEVIVKMLLYFIHERAWDKIAFGKKHITPKVLWFTGLSGSGKSTVSLRVASELKKKGLNVEHLDGDSIRDIFPNTGFTKVDRDQHIKRVGYLASRLERNGIFVVASFVSPYAEARNFVRNLCDNFIEIYISTSLEECERRDTKGLYAKARKGEIANFTGIGDPYEEPAQPELNIDTQHISLEKAVDMVINRTLNGK